MSPTFSIIIPVYNVAPYLRECLDSILAQTYTDWEAICVDDGSTDGSGAILDEYVEKVEKLGGGGHRRLKVLHQPNRGVSAARNAALDVAQGEWFMFVDGDDRLREDALDLLLKNGVDDTTDCVLITPYIPYWDGAAIPPRKLETKVLIENASKEDLVLGPYAANGFPFSRIYRRSVLGDLRFRTDMHMAEDVCFWFDALKKEARWRIVQAEYYLYRSRADSVCGRKSPHDCADTLESVLHAFEDINGGALPIKDGAREYFMRFPYSPHEYLSIVTDRAMELNRCEWRDINDKWNRILKVIGAWPFDVRLKRRFWLASHTITRPFVIIIDWMYTMQHWIGCCLAVVGLKGVVKKIIGRA